MNNFTLNLFKTYFTFGVYLCSPQPGLDWLSKRSPLFHLLRFALLLISRVLLLFKRCFSFIKAFLKSQFSSLKMQFKLDYMSSFLRPLIFYQVLCAPFNSTLEKKKKEFNSYIMIYKDSKYILPSHQEKKSEISQVDKKILKYHFLATLMAPQIGNPLLAGSPGLVCYEGQWIINFEMCLFQFC